jgi:hypothetical protein
LLLGIPGLVVTGVTERTDGQLTADVETHPDLREQARECHGCGMRGIIRERPLTQPRDVPWGARMIRLQWRKMRLECVNAECPAGTFTEWLPAVPPRARLTSREREQIGADVGDDLLAVAAAARRHGVSERTAQAAFDGYAEARLADLHEESGTVEAAGIDEFRRGVPRPASGDRQARPEWFTHLVDPGTGGTLGLAQERTGQAGKSLVKDHEGTLRYLAMDLSAPYRSAVPDGVTVIADAFHLVQLANRKTGGCPTAPGTAMRTSACPARCTTCSGTTSRPSPLITWASSSTPWQRRRRAADRRRLDCEREAQKAPRPPRHQDARHPRTERRPRQPRQLLPLVRRPQPRPRTEDPREHHRKMAAARYRRNPDRLLQRQSRGTQPHRQARRPHRPRVREPREPVPPCPHGHHPQRPPRHHPTITHSNQAALTLITTSDGQAVPETASRPRKPRLSKETQ